MSESLIYHLLPNAATGGWMVTRESHAEPLADFLSLDEALFFARHECQRFVGLAELLVHDASGTLERTERPMLPAR